MADLSDVTAYLAQQATLAVYPNGPGLPSISPPAPGFPHAMDVRVYEGWPLPEQLDLDVGGKTIVNGLPQSRANGPLANVSVFPMPGTGREVYQILDKTYTIIPPQFGLTVVQSGGSPTSMANQITITGTPAQGEYVTLVADRKFVFSVGGATAQDILNQLFALAQAKYSLATLNGSTLTVPIQYELDVRQGGTALLGKTLHRQCQFVMVTVWAPNAKTRAVLCSAIDVLLQQTIIVQLPDGSDVKIVYNRTTVDDSQQNQSIYRRDLVYDCEYATLETFPGYVITSVTPTVFKVNDPTNIAQASTVVSLTGPPVISN